MDIGLAWGRRETQKKKAHFSDLSIDTMIIYLFSRKSLECVDWI
jgi:hypothetical protein